MSQVNGMKNPTKYLIKNIMIGQLKKLKKKKNL